MGYRRYNRIKACQVAVLTPLLIAAVNLQSFSAHAQGGDCSEIQCRARLYFRTCSKPDDGKTLISARVKSLSTDNCYNIMTLDVENAVAERLPPSIEIDLGPCNFFGGEVGETIQIALRLSHSPDVRRYVLGCQF